jgi:hypothetical protein
LEVKGLSPFQKAAAKSYRGNSGFTFSRELPFFPIAVAVSKPPLRESQIPLAEPEVRKTWDHSKRIEMGAT